MDLFSSKKKSFGFQLSFENLTLNPSSLHMSVQSLGCAHWPSVQTSFLLLSPLFLVIYCKLFLLCEWRCPVLRSIVVNMSTCITHHCHSSNHQDTLINGPIHQYKHFNQLINWRIKQWQYIKQINSWTNQFINNRINNWQTHPSNNRLISEQTIK